MHAPRTATEWDARRDGPPLLVLDPRVPGQRPDSALGSVLGRPSPDTPVGRHFAELMRRRPVLPRVDAVVDLFRRRDADRRWLAGLLARSRAGCSMSGMPVRRTTITGTAAAPIGRPCIWPTRRRCPATPTPSAITGR